MPDRAAPQNRYNMWTGQKNHGTTDIFLNRGELLKQGLNLQKTQRRSPLEGLHH